jgi:hypothetical protein
MSNDCSKLSAAKRVPPAVLAAVWIFAIGAPSLVLHANRVDAARREAEGRVLTQVAAAINSPSTGREAVMSLLERNQGELTDARYVRTCNLVGIPMNWNTLFENIRGRGKDEQAKAARIIAQEYGLVPDMNLKREQMFLAMRVIRTAGMERTPPISEHSRRLASHF